MVGTRGVVTALWLEHEAWRWPYGRYQGRGYGPVTGTKGVVMALWPAESGIVLV